MKLIGLISPNLSEDTLVDVYQVLPEGIRIEGRTLKVGKYTDDEFHRAEQAFADLVRDLCRQPLDFLMVTGELFLSYKGPGSDRQILDLVKTITPVPASTVLTAVTRGCRALGLKRVVMASPFPDDQDERLARFLAHDGIEVVAFRGLGSLTPRSSGSFHQRPAMIWPPRCCASTQTLTVYICPATSGASSQSSTASKKQAVSRWLRIHKRGFGRRCGRWG